MPIIEINNVSKFYHDTAILNQINVSFDAGRIYGIVGRNGSGKTVLFKCICGLMSVSEGTIRIRGEVVSGDTIPGEIGAIIETPGFLPNLSGFRNLYLLAKIQNRITKKVIADTMLLVGLDPKNPKHVRKYSLGMRQRLGIAQAIMEDPDILILDEPFNGLDNEGVAEMRKIFMKMKEAGKTILLASHNKEDINMLCDKVYRMEKGILLPDFENSLNHQEPPC